MSQRPHCVVTSACLPRHPAVAYLRLVRSMKLLVGAMLLGLCGSGAAFARSPALAQLAPGDRIHVAYHNRGCFHDRTCDIDFQRGASITARASGRIVTLSPREVDGLDRLIAFYRSRRRCGCTTQDDITISIFRRGEPVSREHYVDRSCATYQMKGVTRFYEIAKKLGLEHDTET